jgi:DNA-binding HxlR family transcriptional regulator
MPISRMDYSSENCSVRRALEVVGEKWTLLVLREALYGIRRFDEMQRATGAPRNVLSARLDKLVENGILRRVPYQEEGSRTRNEYRLTEKGAELVPVVVALMDWGDRWEADDDGPALTLRHRDCGAAVHAHLECDAGHGPLTARDTRPEPGPGARAAA